MQMVTISNQMQNFKLKKKIFFWKIGASELWASENPPSSASSGFSDDDSLAGTDGGDPKTIEQIVEMVKERGRQGLIKEYQEIRARAPEGTFTQAR